MDGPTRIFDRDLLDRRRRRALRAGAADFLLRHVADDLAERLGTVKRRFPLAVDLGSPLPLLADRLVATGQVDEVIRIDRLPEALAGGPHLAIAGDEEVLPLAPESVDLIVSALVLHLVNDLPGTLAQIRRALKPDGLFLAVLLGGDTLVELRSVLAQAESELTGGAAPRVAPFAEVRTLGALLQRAGFALPVVDQDRLTVRYPDALALMRDLRGMGGTNILLERSRRPLRRSVLSHATALYRQLHSASDHRVPATFDIISLSGWAPHESQQKPLRPGSAKARLADVLGTVERSTGEKPDV